MNQLEDLFKNYQELSEIEVDIDIMKVSLAFSRGLDQAHSGLLNHHMRVSMLALHLGQYLNMSEEELVLLFQVANTHDIGAISLKEKSNLLEFELKNLDHCQRGYDLIQGLDRYENAAEVIRCHHDRWEGGNESGLSGEQIPLYSRIINLVDRVDIILQHQKEVNVLLQRDKVLTIIEKSSGTIFDPTLVAAFCELAKSENIWLDLDSPLLADRIYNLLPKTSFTLNSRELLDFALLFSRVVDAQSSYTYYHSNNVADTTKSLAELMDCSSEQVFYLYIAGLLHDLGKVTISEEILHKPGPLNKEEMTVMKQHTYFTYWWLKGASLDIPLAEWAAFHHERLDGKGYPFRKNASEIDLGARIVAVSDIFSALREDRPYRASLSWGEIERILLQQVKTGGLDQQVVKVLLENKEIVDIKEENRTVKTIV